MTACSTPLAASCDVTAAACRGATTSTKPIPMLNVFHISVASTAPSDSNHEIDGRRTPFPAIDDGPATLGKDAFDVVDQAAARDVRHAVHGRLAGRCGEHVEHGPHVDSRRLQEGLADGAIQRIESVDRS